VAVKEGATLMISGVIGANKEELVEIGHKHLQHQPFGQIPYIGVRHFPFPYLMRRPYTRVFYSFFVI
jgi:hypothetical protein